MDEVIVDSVTQQQLQEEYVQVDLTASTETFREVPLAPKADIAAPAEAPAAAEKDGEPAPAVASPAKKALSRKSSSSSVKSNGDKKTPVASPVRKKSASVVLDPLAAEFVPSSGVTPPSTPPRAHAGSDDGAASPSDASVSPQDDAKKSKSAKKKKGGKKNRR